jgi:hypothetical protein
MQNIRYSCQVLVKLEFSRELFEKYPNTKFHENPSSSSRVVPCGRAHRQRHDEAYSRFSQILETDLTISSCDGILKKNSVFVEVAMPYILMFMVNMNTAVVAYPMWSTPLCHVTLSFYAQCDMILGQFHPTISPQPNT